MCVCVCAYVDELKLDRDSVCMGWDVYKNLCERTPLHLNMGTFSTQKLFVLESSSILDVTFNEY